MTALRHVVILEYTCKTAKWETLIPKRDALVTGLDMTTALRGLQRGSHPRGGSRLRSDIEIAAGSECVDSP